MANEPENNQNFEHCKDYLDNPRKRDRIIRAIHSANLKEIQGVAFAKRLAGDFYDDFMADSLVCIHEALLLCAEDPNQNFQTVLKVKLLQAGDQASNDCRSQRRFNFLKVPLDSIDIGTEDVCKVEAHGIEKASDKQYEKAVVAQGDAAGSWIWSSKYARADSKWERKDQIAKAAAWLRQNIKHKNRLIYLLHNKFGVDQTIIAERFGITHQAVNQRIQAVQTRLEKYMKRITEG